MRTILDTLQTIQNAKYGHSVMIAFTPVSNATHVGEVKQEDVALLKQIMRATAAIEMDTIDFGMFANDVLKQVQSKSQLDRISAEPRLVAYIRDEFDKRKEHYQKEKQNAKDKLGLETTSEIDYFND